MARVVILGAAGRDFHVFNTEYRDAAEHEVVAFTATQIPNIAGRVYPPELAGPRYPAGIPIRPEADLEALIAGSGVERVVFAYSDITHEHVMHLAARAVAAGAEFVLGGAASLLEPGVPTISVTAARTGAGKSQTSRKLRRLLHEGGRRVAAIRHPMPYGDLRLQRVQRFAAFGDLDAAGVTIEEREEFEPYLRDGATVFAGVDYADILRAAEREADVIIWDGGNNDTPFIRPGLDICVVDPHRAGHESRYWPGEVNVRRAGVIIVNKMDTAAPEDVAAVRANLAALNPAATIVEADSPVRVDDPELITGKRVLVVEDGPTITHGEMAFGAGAVAARRLGAAELIDPRPHAVGSLAGVFDRYRHIGPVLPAMGYGAEQQADLLATIRACRPETVVIGTPIDLERLLGLEIQAARVFYDLMERGEPNLETLLAGFLA